MTREESRDVLEAALAAEDEFMAYLIDKGWNLKHGYIKSVWVAARKQLALMPEKCIDCGGSGVGSQSIGYVSKDYPCLTCHGSGKVYSRDFQDRMRQAVILGIEAGKEGYANAVDVDVVTRFVLDALGETE